MNEIAQILSQRSDITEFDIQGDQVSFKRRIMPGNTGSLQHDIFYGFNGKIVNTADLLYRLDHKQPDMD